MKLIADSGSTKTEWILLDDKTISINTIGLNPVFVNEQTILQTIEFSDLNKYKDAITEVHFFGAGCSSDERKKIIKNPLSKFFKNAKIEVDTDLLGAGISMFATNEGIIGILGTGSNTGYYKNKSIIKNVSSLGYILGDEGSGAHIGKMFIKAFLDKEIPENIATEFNSQFNLSLDDIISKVYKEPFPNRFLASFMPFIHSFKSDVYIQNLLYICFTEFFQKTILKYDNYKQNKICLIGSVAHFFESEIKLSAKKLDIKIDKIAKNPSNGLIEFYK